MGGGNGREQWTDKLAYVRSRPWRRVLSRPSFPQAVRKGIANKEIPCTSVKKIRFSIILPVFGDDHQTLKCTELETGNVRTWLLVIGESRDYMQRRFCIVHLLSQFVASLVERGKLTNSIKVTIFYDMSGARGTCNHGLQFAIYKTNF